jgi:hypothetical protein
MALLTQAARQQLGHLRFVLDDEHSHQGIVSSGDERGMNRIHHSLISGRFPWSECEAYEGTSG